MEFQFTVIRVAKNLSNGSRDKLETHQASVGRGMFEVTLYSFTKERGNLGYLREDERRIFDTDVVVKLDLKKKCNSDFWIFFLNT